MLRLESFTSIHELVTNLDSIRNKNYLTHNIHPYLAKFIPQIPSCIIENYSKTRDSILDPFCGSGTTLLEAILHQRGAIGLDLNPIATLISKVKTSVLTAKENGQIFELIGLLDTALQKMNDNDTWLYEQINENEISSFHNIDHWFQYNVKQELAYIKKLIYTYCDSEKVHDYLKLCLSAIIVKVANQDSDTRWVAVHKNINNGHTIRTYKKTLSANIKKTEDLQSVLNFNMSHVTVFNDNVLNIEKLIEPSSVDLIVTSPPYLNSYDYYLYHKLRMFWLDYDHKKVQTEEIGSRNKHCYNQEDINSFKESMKKTLKALRHVLKANGRCVFIIGDSIYRGTVINMANIYEEIAGDVGFLLLDRASFNQRRYSKAFSANYKRGYKESHILVFGS